MNRLAEVMGLALWLGASLVRAEPVVERGAAQPLPAPEPWVFDSPFGREVAAYGGPRLPWAQGREAWISQDGRYVALRPPATRARGR